MMNPVVQRRKKNEIRQFPLFTCRLYFLFILRIHVEHSSWNYLTTIVYSNYLTFEKMALFSFKVRISIYLPVQIPSEKILYTSRGIDLIRSNQRQFLPITTQQISCHPVCHFVDTCTSRFYLKRKFAFFSSFQYSFNDIVIVLFAQNLSPKFDFFDLLCHRKSFQSLEDNKSCLLSESDPSFFKQFGLFNQIGQVSTRPRFCRLFFSPNIRLIDESFEFFSILYQFLKLFVSECIMLLNAMLDAVRVMLKEMVTISIIAEDHLLEHLNKMCVYCHVSFLQSLEFGLHRNITYLIIQIQESQRIIQL